MAGLTVRRALCKSYGNFGRKRLFSSLIPLLVSFSSKNLSRLVSLESLFFFRHKKTEEAAAKVAGPEVCRLKFATTVKGYILSHKTRGGRVSISGESDFSASRVCHLYLS
jgi:hypothetical protein